MKRHRFLRLTIITASAFILGVSTTNAVHNHTSVTITAQASSYNNYLSNRVDKFARQRRPEHHPDITYNTRDLGGLRAANGRHIQYHMLYRSANLNSLKWRGAQVMKRLNIKHDIDLRALHGPNTSISSKPQPGEFHLQSDPYGLRLHYHYYPVETSQQEAYTWPIRKRLGETYRFGYWYTLSKTARQAYHDSVMEAIRNGRHHRGALMYNCTQGRDRTGVLSAILEYLLGVSKYNIYNDFLLSNHYFYQSPYSDQISRINHFYNTVYRYYGSMNHYVIHGLNLSPHNINLLRKEYLTR